jgi:hypothetical protein
MIPTPREAYPIPMKASLMVISILALHAMPARANSSAARYRCDVL